jgi:hypothetical protein
MKWRAVLFLVRRAPMKALFKGFLIRITEIASRLGSKLQFSRYLLWYSITTPTMSGQEGVTVIYIKSGGSIILRKITTF